jgi:hypothetical protein
MNSLEMYWIHSGTLHFLVVLFIVLETQLRFEASLFVFHVLSYAVHSLLVFLQILHLFDIFVIKVYQFSVLGLLFLWFSSLIMPYIHF